MSAFTSSVRESRRVLLAPVIVLLAVAPVHSQDEPEPPVDHSAMGHETPADEEPAPPVDHAAMGHTLPPPASVPREPVPPLSDADRAAAFPEIAAHAAHGAGLHSYMLFDRLEAWDADPGTGLAWDALGWFGSDLDRLWLRSEGERIDGATETADVELLYGHAAARWWDFVGGVRLDFGTGPSQTFAGIGVIGRAPYNFEVEATAYVGESGQTTARFEIEYDMLLTNRLIIQWRADADLYGKDDARRGIGSGLSTLEAGVRVRYEVTRQFAPFVGVAWDRAYGGTADLRREQGEDVDDARFVAGLRLWF
jgi:copper resistance protein B